MHTHVHTHTHTHLHIPKNAIKIGKKVSQLKQQKGQGTAPCECPATGQEKYALKRKEAKNKGRIQTKNLLRVYLQAFP